MKINNKKKAQLLCAALVIGAIAWFMHQSKIEAQIEAQNVITQKEQEIEKILKLGNRWGYGHEKFDKLIAPYIKDKAMAIQLLSKKLSRTYGHLDTSLQEDMEVITYALEAGVDPQYLPDSVRSNANMILSLAKAGHTKVLAAAKDDAAQNFEVVTMAAKEGYLSERGGKDKQIVIEFLRAHPKEALRNIDDKLKSDPQVYKALVDHAITYGFTNRALFTIHTIEDALKAYRKDPLFIYAIDESLATDEDFIDTLAQNIVWDDERGRYYKATAVTKALFANPDRYPTILNRDGKFIRWLDEEDRNKPKLLKIAHKTFGQAYKWAYSFCNDVDAVDRLMADSKDLVIEESIGYLRLRSELRKRGKEKEALNDLKFVSTHYSQIRDLVGYASKEIKSNANFAKQMILKEGLLYARDMNPVVWENIDLASFMIRYHGIDAWYLFNEKTQLNPDLAFLAIQKGLKWKKLPQALVQSNNFLEAMNRDAADVLPVRKDEYLYANTDIFLDNLRKDWKVVLNMPIKMWSERVFEALEQHRLSSTDIYYLFTERSDIGLKIVTFDWKFAQKMMDSKVYTLQMAEAAVAGDWRAILFLPMHYKNEKSVAIKCVTNNGLSLQYFSENLRGDKEVVVPAIQQNWEALKFASDVLRKESMSLLTSLDMK